MKKTKWIATGIAVLCAGLLLCACGKAEEQPSEGTPTAQVTQPPQTQTAVLQTPAAETPAAETPTQTPAAETLNQTPTPSPMENVEYFAAEGMPIGDAVLLGDNMNTIDGDHVGSGVEWEIDVNLTGIYTVKIYYHTPVDATLTVTIDETVQSEKVSFQAAPQGQWAVRLDDVYSIYQVKLTEGEQVFRLTREEDDLNFVAIGGISLTYGEASGNS